MTRLQLVIFSGLLCVLLEMQNPCRAQQTIFNVPSADVTPEGEIFLQHESQTRPWQPGAFWLGTHYFAYGIGQHTELDATLINLSAPASDNVSLMLGMKTAMPVLSKPFPKQEFKVTVGGMLPVSLQGNGVGSWVYGHISGRVPKLNTRLTAGISGGTENLFGRDTVHAIAAYEQPVTKRFSLIGDWFSGTHSDGFFIPGFSYVLTPKSTAYFGYQIPNNSRCGRSGIVFELSRYF